MPQAEFNIFTKRLGGRKGQVKAEGRE